IISIGFGLGPVLGTIAALLHVYNHAVTKSLMFFGAGNIISAYHKHNMNGIRGVIKVLPFTGVMMLLGMFALTGFPPFSIFISEILILLAAFLKGSYLVAGLMLLFLVIIFTAFMNHFSKMFFGNMPRDIKPQKEALSIKLSILFLFFQVCALGAVLPFIKKDLIWIAQRLFQV
ncbi:MAG: proton-conducting transporter membrane subunit, partial [Candidatus Omnitrophica bacterium]|nr:proton-conducting transporter membrane subunit [Candidatus Omnitrophota bacterium]